MIEPYDSFLIAGASRGRAGRATRTPRKKAATQLVLSDEEDEEDFLHPARSRDRGGGGGGAGAAKEGAAKKKGRHKPSFSSDEEEEEESDVEATQEKGRLKGGFWVFWTFENIVSSMTTPEPIPYIVAVLTVLLHIVDNIF